MDDLSREIAHAPSDSAFIGDVCWQAYLSNFVGREKKRLRFILNEISEVKVASLNYPPQSGMASQEPLSIQYASPHEFGPFSSHYSDMIHRKQEIQIYYQGGSIRIPVIPVEYFIAQKLCEGGGEWEVGYLLKIGGDKIKHEQVRCLLKTVGRQNAFETYQELLYSLCSE